MDYRDGKTVAMTEWTLVDLTALGEVDNIQLSMSSSDTGDYGMNTPAFIAIDDFTYQKD